MKFTKAAFGDALRAQLVHSYEPRRLARWAYRSYLDHANDLEPGLYEEIMKVATMEEGPEFELSAEEIKCIVKNLVES